MHRAADALPGLGLRRARRLLDPRAPRGDRRQRDLAASPPLVRSRSPTRQLGLVGARATWTPTCSEGSLDSEGSGMCSTSVTAGAVEGDADGVEADLGVAGAAAGGARPSRRRRGGGPGAACAGSTARTGRSGPTAAPGADRPSPRRRRGGGRRGRRCRARRSGCGRCARAISPAERRRGARRRRSSASGRCWRAGHRAVGSARHR